MRNSGLSFIILLIIAIIAVYLITTQMGIFKTQTGSDSPTEKTAVEDAADVVNELNDKINKSLEIHE